MDEENKTIREIRDELTITSLRGRLELIVAAIQFETEQAMIRRERVGHGTIAWDQHNETVNLLNRLLIAQVID